MIAEPEQLARVERPVIRYFGSKWRLAPWIMSHFKPHDSYIEPFGGSASVLLQKEPSKLTVYNDLDREVFTFFKVLRDRPQELAKLLKNTPYSIEEFRRAYDPTEDELELARRFFVRAWQGYGGPRAKRKSGWKRQPRVWDTSRQCQISEWNKVKQVMGAARVFRGVHLENRPAIEVVKSFDNPKALFYLDPPYLEATRNRRWTDSYTQEMELWEHAQLLKFLCEVKGQVIISTYPNDLYEKELQGWGRVARSSRTMSHAKQAQEVLYIKPWSAE